MRPSHLDSPVTWSDIWTKIEPSYWRDFKLDPIATGELLDDRGHTEPEQHVSHNLSRRYCSLRVGQPDIEREWPKALQAKPKPDLPLTGLLIRVYKKLGPPPHDDDQRQAFYRRVNLEISDKVAVHQLHVWGRLGDLPLQAIYRHEWSHGRFDHRGKRFVHAYDFGTRDFTDLHFNKAEIDEHWPQEAER